jgi:hypothetical protein
MQMSYWGDYLALNGPFRVLGLDVSLIELTGGFIASTRRIGPHNSEIVSFKTGSL